MKEIMTDGIDKEEYTDIVGKHIETFLAVLVRSVGKINNLAVGNVVKVGDKEYAYQFSIHGEGTPQHRNIKNQIQSSL